MKLILGVDGRVHTGTVMRRMTGMEAATTCQVPAMRQLAPSETWWQADENRMCPRCFEGAEEDSDAAPMVV